MLEVRPGETILEIGCGTGMALDDLSNWVGDKGAVHGLDLSPGMLQVAGARLVKGSHVKSASLSCGDGACLPYASGVFSSLFMSFTLELFDTPEIPMVLAECWRYETGWKVGDCRYVKIRANQSSSSTIRMVPRALPHLYGLPPDRCPGSDPGSWIHT